MPSIGKIGRLPHALREELNRKLQDAVPGIELVNWLNSLEPVQKIMAAWFGGRPITDGNLSEWKNGGYHQWVLRQETMMFTFHNEEEAGDLDTQTHGRYSDSLALVLEARYGMLIAQWDCNLEDKGKFKALREITADVVRLRKGDHNHRRVQILERDKRFISKDDFLELFYQWTELPPVRKWITNGEKCPSKRLVTLKRLFKMDEKMDERQKRTEAAEAEAARQNPPTSGTLRHDPAESGKIQNPERTAAVPAASSSTVPVPGQPAQPPASNPPSKAPNQNPAPSPESRSESGTIRHDPAESGKKLVPIPEPNTTNKATSEITRTE